MDLSILFKAAMKLPLEWNITDIATDERNLTMKIALSDLSSECACEAYNTSSEIISYQDDSWRYMNFMAFKCFIQTK